MRLTVFGATGSTGTHLVGQARAAGDDVTAVVRGRAGCRSALIPGSTSPKPRSRTRTPSLPWSPGGTR